LYKKKLPLHPAPPQIPKIGVGEQHEIKENTERIYKETSPKNGGVLPRTGKETGC
jgi:hypothetical protein